MADPITGYPLIVPSTLGVQTTTNGVEIPYTVSSGISNDDIKHLEIKLMRQSNNLLLGSDKPDGIIYKDVITNPIAIEYTWETGAIYKIQIRYGNEAIPNNFDKSFAETINTWRNNHNLSEWSNVLIFKTVDTSSITATMPEIGEADPNSSDLPVINTLTPLFKGVGVSDVKNKEPIINCKFDLMDDNGNLIETSDWILGNGNDSYRFKTHLEDFTIYLLLYSIRTLNGYEVISKRYSIEVILSEWEELDGVTLTADNNTVYSQENGCNLIYLIMSEAMTGNFVLSRASEDDGFTRYEDILRYTYINLKLTSELIYTDFTIESGKLYKYAFLKELKGVRTSPNYSNIILTDLEYSYLYHDGVQLKVMLNQKMNSFKKTTLRTKLDTLGGKYPKLIANGNAYYAEFPITGLISLHMDELGTFLRQRDTGLYCGDELVIPVRKLDAPYKGERPYSLEQVSAAAASLTGDNTLTIDYNLTADNFYAERKFRDCVEQFLNNFDYKLYRSPSEGNMPVVLMNVTLTPQDLLGRMIYSFSATAYEVFDNTWENLVSYGIVALDKYINIGEETQTYPNFGQIVNLSDGNIDAFAQIQQKQREIPIGEDNLLFVLSSLDYIEVENTILENNSLGTIKLNGTTINILPYRKFVYEGAVNSLTISPLLLVNYKCSNKIEHINPEREVAKVRTKKVWGLIVSDTHEDILAEIKEAAVPQSTATEESEFTRLISVDILDIYPNNNLLVNGLTVAIGSTNRYILDENEEPINKLKFNKPTYAIVNYVATIITIFYKEVTDG